MSDDNPFDDLGTVEESESAESSETSQPEPVSEPQQQVKTEPVESKSEPSGPSFEYSEVRQRPLYARGETWDRFEDAVGISVVPSLRQADIRDEEKREIHDAVLQLAVENPDQIVDIILEQRQDS